MPKLYLVGIQLVVDDLSEERCVAYPIICKNYNEANIKVRKIMDNLGYKDSQYDYYINEITEVDGYLIGLLKKEELNEARD